MAALDAHPESAPSQGQLPDAYPIIEVERETSADAPEFDEEAMGSKRKFWYTPRGGARRWLFKYSQEGTGQHWAEKIAAEVAAHLDVPHARVELAHYKGHFGAVSESFLEHIDLFHGNEVLASTMDYDRKKRFGQSDHTLNNIFRSFDVWFRPRDAEQSKREFARYVVLDALIGNTDRHHENWGFVARFVQIASREFVQVSLAPAFDHASSLGRELRDERRAALLAAGNVGRYSERGRGGIYWLGQGRHGPSPLELVRLAAHEYPDLLREPIARVSGCQSGLETLVRRVPDDWMSESAKDFAIALLHYNAAQLEEIVR